MTPVLKFKNEKFVLINYSNAYIKNIIKPSNEDEYNFLSLIKCVKVPRQCHFKQQALLPSNFEIFFNISHFLKILSLESFGDVWGYLYRMLFWTRYQIVLYLWRLRSVLKSWNVSQNYNHDWSYMYLKA